MNWIADDPVSGPGRGLVVGVAPVKADKASTVLEEEGALDA